MGYRSVLSSVIRFKLPEISSSPVLQDLLKSFKVQSSTYEHLANLSLRSLTKKVLFLLSLATAQRVGELQVLAWLVSFSSTGATVSYVPEFLAKTESALQPLPCSFLVKSLSDNAKGLDDDLLLCPVRCLLEYVRQTSGGVNRPRRLSVSSRNPSRMSKNAISYFLREVITESGASKEPGVVPRAHSIRDVATSAAFHRNWSVSSVLDVASWRSNPVFTSFYLKDLHFEFDGLCSLGLFIAAGVQIG